jgi:hypothetical protein
LWRYLPGIRNLRLQFCLIGTQSNTRQASSDIPSNRWCLKCLDQWLHIDISHGWLWGGLLDVDRLSGAQYEKQPSDSQGTKDMSPTLESAMGAEAVETAYIVPLQYDAMQP